ncbi:hypothetical protein CS542_07525 [Pedobacter sp. IW39]|nr:hypothetical protein CS542_07525 [Pedobacter sp. IW39]
MPFRRMPLAKKSTSCCNLYFSYHIPAFALAVSVKQIQACRNIFYLAILQSGTKDSGSVMESVQAVLEDRSLLPQMI